MLHVDEQAGIHTERHCDAVARHRRHVAQRLVLLLPARAQPRLGAIGGLDIRLRAHLHITHRSVDNDGVAAFDEIGDVGDIADRRDAERARDHRDMARRAAVLQNEAA